MAMAIPLVVGMATPTLAASVHAYLAQAPLHSGWVTSATPLSRSVRFDPAKWASILNGPFGTGVAAAVPVGTGNPRIDRTLLAALSTAAFRSRTPNDYVTLWLTTMMWGWGSDWLAYRGRRNVARGLADPQLLAALVQSATLIYQNTLLGASAGFRLAGSGQPFATKWFWSVALGNQAVHPRPLILDSRVKQVLRLVHPGVLPSSQWSHARYARYVDSLAATGGLLRPTVPNIDGEKLEWLMFDRPGEHGPRFGEPCFVTWLQRAIPPAGRALGGGTGGPPPAGAPPAQPLRPT